MSDANTKVGKEPFLDYDLFSNSQDGVFGYRLGKPVVNGYAIAVSVAMQYCKTCSTRHELDAIVRNENGTYVIDDLRYPDGTTLRGFFHSYFKI